MRSYPAKSKRFIEKQVASAKSFDVVLDYAKLMISIVVPLTTALVSGFAALISSKKILLSDMQMGTLAIAFLFLAACIYFLFDCFSAVSGTLDAVANPNRTEEAKKAGAHPSIYNDNIRIPFQRSLLLFYLGMITLFFAILWISFFPEQVQRDPGPLKSIPWSK